MLTSRDTARDHPGGCAGSGCQNRKCTLSQVCIGSRGVATRTGNPTRSGQRSQLSMVMGMKDAISLSRESRERTGGQFFSGVLSARVRERVTCDLRIPIRGHLL